MRIQGLYVKMMCMLLYTFLFLLTGCSEDAASAGAEKPSTIQDTEADSTYTRETGKITEGGVNELLHTVFFDFQVVSFDTPEYMMLGDDMYRLEDGYQFLVCEVSLTNPQPEAMDIYLTDFLVCWGEAETERDYGYGSDTLGDSAYMPESFLLEVGEQVTYKLMFKVPVQESYLFLYDEFYADGFQGNQFRVVLKEE